MKNLNTGTMDNVFTTNKEKSGGKMKMLSKSATNKLASPATIRIISLVLLLFYFSSIVVHAEEYLGERNYINDINPFRMAEVIEQKTELGSAGRSDASYYPFNSLYSALERERTSPVFSTDSLLDDLYSANETKQALSERQKTILYQVVKNDTLWEISGKYGVTIESIKRVNNLKSDLIVIGQKLTIKINEDSKGFSEGVSTYLANSKLSAPKKRQVSIASTASPASGDSEYWLAKIIEAEAGGEILKGKIAVGAVVLNRVDDDWFPDSIKDVIFQKYKGNYQFSPVGDGRIYKVKVSADSIEAARRALQGEDPTNGALFFYNPKISKSTFFKTRRAVAMIGNHKFFY